MKRTRLLLCLTSLRRSEGGIATFNRNLIRALQTLEPVSGPLELHALVFHDPARPPLDVEYLPHPERYSAQGCSSGRLRYVARYLRMCLSWRPDLVVCGHLHLASVSRLAQSLTASPYLVFCHLVECLEEVTWLRRSALRKAALVVGVSDFTTGLLVSKYGLPRTATCHNGLDEISLPSPSGQNALEFPDAFGTARSLGGHYILMVSRLDAGERYKGHEQIIGVLPDLLQHAAETQIVIVGEGNDRARLQGLARRSGAGQAVLFTGFVEPATLARLFSRCRVFALPSRGEGFGLVYLEAMHFAKPCVASLVDAGAEIVRDAETGLLVDPDRPQQLAGALVRLLTDDALARRLGQAGRARLDGLFRFEHFRERVAALLTPWIGAQHPQPSR